MNPYHDAAGRFSSKGAMAARAQSRAEKRHSLLNRINDLGYSGLKSSATRRGAGSIKKRFDRLRRHGQESFNRNITRRNAIKAPTRWG